MERVMSTAMQEWPRRHRITVEHFYRMAGAGLFEPEERVELINGEIIDMPPMGSRHASTVQQLAADLTMALGARAILRQQLPLRLSDDSEPMPDIAVVAARPDRYRTSHPNGAEALLVIEVSESTLRYDRDVRVPMYALHGVPEVWIVDLQANQLRAYRSPRNGAYEVAEVRPFERTALAALPRVTVDLTPLS
jgi:Uma2 family endonuclease